MKKWFILIRRMVPESNYKILDILCKKRVVEDMLDKMKYRIDLRDDLAQEIYLILLEYPNLEEIYNKGQINFFISRVIMNQGFSSTSDFYRKYVRYIENKRELLDIFSE